MISASSAPAGPAHHHCSQASSHLVRREQRAGLVLTQTGTPSSCEFDLTLTPLPDENLEQMLRRLHAVLREYDAVPVLQFVFGTLSHLSGGLETVKRVFEDVEWPITWAEGTGIHHGIAGIQVFAVSRRPIKCIRQGESVIATVFENGPARHCLVGGLGYSRPQEQRTEQTRKALCDLEGILKSQGFAFSDIARTWFYLEDILSWYTDFNQVRTLFYNQYAFRVGSTPASTGICAGNPWGSALSAAAWATRPLNDSHVPVREIISPLQCPAANYGSSFSRAIEMDLPNARRVLVSGTASIEPGGQTVHIGDIVKQIDLTMEVIEAILRSRGMSFADTTRSTAYCKHPDYAKAFARWCQTSGHRFPTAVAIHCDICRDDLLFELELDTVKAC